MSDPEPVLEGPEADDLLAIELAFGLLDPDARAHAERRVRDEASFAASYQIWHARALSLLEGREERPSARTWAAIVRRLPANDERSALRRWQAATGIAAATALALGATLALRPEPASEPNEAPAPIERSARPRPLVAVLASPERKDVVAVSYDVTTGGVSVLPQRLATGGLEAQLWVIPTGGKPVSAGLVSPGDRTELIPGRTLTALIVPGATIAVSLEPRGGSRTGAPTGPVILTGTVARS